MAELVALGMALAASIAGGAMNALAGGGTFATMPTLVAIGLPSPIANATSNVALQPGAIAAAWSYRDGLRPVGGMSIRLLCAITFVAGLAGSLLLVATPTRVFDVIIPWLLLMATLVMAFGKKASDTLHRHVTIGRKTLVVTQFILGIYGGYFGGGVSLMMMAAWSLLANAHPHELAAPRTLMLAIANSAAAVIFIASGMVVWHFAVPMLVGAITGGYLGARLGRVLSPTITRVVTLAVTATMTAVFFWRVYA